MDRRKKKNIMEITNVKNIQYITDLGSVNTALKKQLYLESNQPYHIIQYTVKKQMFYHFKKKNYILLQNILKTILMKNLIEISMLQG